MSKQTYITTFYILFTILYCGCGLFETRSVEPPVDPRSNFKPPTSPDIVIQNVQTCITEKNVNNYMQCFVDSAYSSRRFSYTADVTSQIQYPIFRSWQLNYERVYFSNLIALSNTNAISYLIFSNMVMNPSSDSAVFDADYSLKFEHLKTTVSQNLSGKIRLSISSDSRNLWGIHNWIDIKPLESDTTWSVLKANFVN